MGGHPPCTGQLVFKVLAQDAGFHVHPARFSIKGQNAIHAFEVDHEASLSASSASADPRSSAIRNHCDALFFGPLDCRFHFFGSGRGGNDTGRVGQVFAVAPAQGIPWPQVSAVGVQMKWIADDWNTALGQAIDIHKGPLIEKTPGRGRASVAVRDCWGCFSRRSAHSVSVETYCRFHAKLTIFPF